MNREAYERQYRLGVQRGSMESEKKLGEVYDELIKMQTELKHHLRTADPDDCEAHVDMLGSITQCLIKLVGP
jgi:hypothetical protein